MRSADFLVVRKPSLALMHVIAPLFCHKALYTPPPWLTGVNSGQQRPKAGTYPSCAHAGGFLVPDGRLRKVPDSVYTYWMVLEHPELC